jgi:hypothetical protein
MLQWSLSLKADWKRDITSIFGAAAAANFVDKLD